MAQKVAVVLFNLGGPDSVEAIKPFLFNLFFDPAIIRVPKPFRWLLAKLISAKRTPEATEIYSNLGGRSPILPNTEKQAKALKV
ncbi:MAG: ferrochelatase, partial [Pseudomonadota bacterium]